ncbi:MAG: RNA methyltransferase [Verrucomicrobia bacterium]|nr:RNA methyltransferase [Verrucomicrobiota bacterium]
MPIKLIRSLTHPHVKHLVKLKGDKSYRQEQGRLIISPGKVIKQLSRETKIFSLLASQPEHLEGVQAETKILTTDDILRKITGLASPCDMVAEVPLPPFRSLDSSDHLLVLDRLTDPGNMGNLMRTALALGWDGVFVVEGSVDPFNDKVVRAAKGAHFSLPLAMGSPQEALELFQRAKLTPLVADLAGAPVETLSIKGKIALILSNESEGPTPLFAKAAEAVTIAMTGAIESLNVASAGAILLFCLRPLNTC